jgi:hypothetical protein
MATGEAQNAVSTPHRLLPGTSLRGKSATCNRPAEYWQPPRRVTAANSAPIRVRNLKNEESCAMASYTGEISLVW